MPPIRSRLIISRGLKSRSWTIPRGVPHVSLGKGRRQSSKLITRIRLQALAIPPAYSPASDNGPYAVMQERRNARSAQRSAFGAGSMPHIHISLSHDGPIASAVVTISVE